MAPYLDEYFRQKNGRSITGDFQNRRAACYEPLPRSSAVMEGFGLKSQRHFLRAPSAASSISTPANISKNSKNSMSDVTIIPVDHHSR